MTNGKTVVLRMNGDRRGKVYPSVKSLCQENGKDVIGIGLNALWNALSKRKGRFKNKKCTVNYIIYDIKPKEWK